MSERRAAVRAATRPIHVVGAVICAGVIAGAAALVVIPATKRSRSERDTLLALEQVNRQLADASKVNESLGQTARELGKRIQDREVKLTPVSDLNRRVSDLTGLLGEIGLGVEVLQASEPVKGALLTSVPIRLETSGSLEACYDLLGRLEEENPDLQVDSVAIEHTGPERVRLRLQLRWMTAPST